MAENIGKLTSKLVLDNGIWKAKVEETKQSASNLAKSVKSEFNKINKDISGRGKQSGPIKNEALYERERMVKGWEAKQAADIELANKARARENFLIAEKARLERLAASAQAWGAEKSRLGLMQTTTAMDGMSASTRRAKTATEEMAKKSSLMSNSIMGLRKAVLQMAIVWMAFNVLKKPFTWMKESLKEMGDIQDMAEALGDDTKRLGGLMYAARTEGVAPEIMNMALTRLSRRMGDAADGTGDLIIGFKLLNLEYDKMSKLSPSEQFLKIAQGIKELDPKLRQFAIGKIFGRGMIELPDLLTKGEDGLKKLIGEAERLGVAFDENISKRIEDSDVKWNKFMEGIRSAKVSFGIHLSKELETIFADPEKAGKALGQAAKGVMQTISDIMRPVTSFFGIWAKEMARVQDEIDAIESKSADFAAEAAELRALRRQELNQTDLFGLFSKMSDGIDPQSGKNKLQEILQKEKMDKFLENNKLPFEEYLDRRDELYDTFDNMTGMQDRLNYYLEKAKWDYYNAIDGAEKYGVSLGNLSKSEQALIDEMRSKKAAIDEAKQAEEMEEKAIKKRDALIEDMKTPWEKYNEKIEEYKTLLEEGMITQDQFAAAGKKAWNEMKAAADSLDKSENQVFDKMQSDAESIYESTRTPLEKYQQEMGKLEELYRAGFLDHDTFARAGVKAWEDMTQGAEGYAEAMRQMNRSIGEATAVSSLNEVKPSSRIGITGGNLNLNMNETNSLLRQIARNTATPEYARAG